MDFKSLSDATFEEFCTAILEAEYPLVRDVSDASRDLGVDAEWTEHEERTIVQAKHFRRGSVSLRELRKLLRIVEDSRAFLGANRGVLIISAEVPGDLPSDWIPDHVELWDANVLNAKLAEHSIRVARTDKAPTPRGRARRTARASELESRLGGLKPGRDTWREYEDLSVEILNYLFIPPLRAPRIQTRSVDGLDRRDAIYPITRGHSAWDELKLQCRTRFAVAEFKNHKAPPGKNEVDALEQYLYPKAMRSLGLLCSRAPADASALKARESHWRESEKLIVLLSDVDMQAMLKFRADGDDPFEVIEAQLEKFFADLNP